MFIGLQDFDIDIFLKLDDEGIHIYYVDFNSLPKIAEYVPLGSFDDDGKLLLKTLPMKDRINISLEFMHRDLYAEYKDESLEDMIRVDRFLEQFGNIPEVVEFFEPYLAMCDGDIPKEWCSDCVDDGVEAKCAISIPAKEFLKYSGTPIKAWSVQVTGDELQNDNGVITIQAKVYTKDSDGTMRSAQDIKLYDMNSIERSTRNLDAYRGRYAWTSNHLGEVNINSIPNTRDRTPTFSGTVKNLINNEMLLKINSSTDTTFEYKTTAFYNVNNDWSFTVPYSEALVDDNYVLTVIGKDSDGQPVESTENFTIDNQAIIILTDYSNGFINLAESKTYMTVKGSTEDVEDGYPVKITFNSRKYTTPVLVDGTFEIIIPSEAIDELMHGVGYDITAEVEDFAGNEASITESIFVDLQEPVPTIEISPEITVAILQDAIDNNKTIDIYGTVHGDAMINDSIQTHVNTIPFATNVFEDTRFPSNPVESDIDYSDLYYLTILYFNGIYRTYPEYIQDSGTYQMLTDVDFNLNKYSLMLNIKEFFTKEFIYYLKCLPGSLPFGNDYGTGIKLAVQTKNFIIRQLEIESEIKFFIKQFNAVYGNVVLLRDITLVSQESDIGADTWRIEVYADIQKERLIYRLEI